MFSENSHLTEQAAVRTGCSQNCVSPEVFKSLRGVISVKKAMSISVMLFTLLISLSVFADTLSTESTRDSVTAGDFSATRKMLIRK